jgi:beta-phosphoglucomutase-like phosphatase (HAD superfamily)
VAIRAVIFDLGGVVLGSPLHAIAAYEREHGIAAGSVNRVVADTGAEGAWGRLERGLIASRVVRARVRSRVRRGGIRDRRARADGADGRRSQPRPAMLAAIRALRARGLRVAALTNNWPSRSATTARARCAATSTRSSNRACSGSRSPTRASTARVRATRDRVRGGGLPRRHRPQPQGRRARSG